MKISGRLGVKDSRFYIPVFMLLSLFIHSFVSLLTDQIFVLYILLGKQKLKGYSKALGSWDKDIRVYIRLSFKGFLDICILQNKEWYVIE